MTYKEISDLYQSCKSKGGVPSYANMPEYGECSLGFLRTMEEPTDAIKSIIEIGSGLPDNVVVALTPKYISFLRDENGNLLQFA